MIVKSGSPTSYRVNNVGAISSVRGRSPGGGVQRSWGGASRLLPAARC